MSNGEVVRARLLTSAGRYQEALDIAVAHLATDPTDVDALCISADCHRRLGHAQASLDVAYIVVHLAPEDERGHALTGLALITLGRSRARWHSLRPFV